MGEHRGELYWLVVINLVPVYRKMNGINAQYQPRYQRTYLSTAKILILVRNQYLVGITT